MDTVKGLNQISSSKKRYRFETLAERAQRSNVNVAKKIQPDHELILDPSSGPDGCFTKQVLDSLAEYDLSKEFQNFAETVIPLVQSMPLLIHNIDTVVDELIKVLETKSLATPSCFKLVAVLAKDSRSAMYHRVSEILGAMFNLVDPLDVDHDKALFAAVGEIFVHIGAHIATEDPELKLLRPYLVRLLGHRKDFVRRFAGETFAFLVRKLRSKHCRIQVRLLAIVLASQNTLEREQEVQDRLCDGVAQVLFNTVKNVHFTFHSRSKHVIEALVGILRPKTVKEDGVNCLDLTVLKEDSIVEHLAEYDARAKCVEATMHHMREFTRADQCSVVWETLRNEALRALELWQSTALHVNSRSTNTNSNGGMKPNVSDDTVMGVAGNYMGRLLQQFTSWILHRGGTRVSDGEPERVVSLLNKLFSTQVSSYSSVLNHPLCSRMLKSASLDLLFKMWYFANRQIGKLPNVYRDTVSCVGDVFSTSMESIPDSVSNVTSQHLVLLSEFALSTLARMPPKAYVQGLLDPLCRFSDSLLEQLNANNSERTFARENTARAGIVVYTLARVAEKVSQSGLRETHSPRISTNSRMNVASGEHGTILDGVPMYISNTIQAFTAHDLDNHDAVQLLYHVLDLITWCDFADQDGHSRQSIYHALVQLVSTSLHTTGSESTPTAALLRSKAILAIATQISLGSTDTILARRIDTPKGKSKKGRGTSRKAANLDVVVKCMFEQLKRSPTQASSLAACAKLVTSIRTLSERETRLTVSAVEDLTEMVIPLLGKLEENLCHRDHAVRKHSLSLIAVLPALEFKSIDGEDTTTCPLVEQLLEFEQLKLTYENERKMTNHIDHVCMWMRLGKLPDKYGRLLAFYLLGMMHIKFSPAWKASIRGLSAFAEYLDFEHDLWPVLRSHIYTVATLKGSHHDIHDDTLRKEEEAGNGFLNRVESHPSSGESNASFTAQTPSLAFARAQERVLSGMLSRRSTMPEQLFETTMEAVTQSVKWTESRNRDLVPLFLRFLHDQYYQGQRKDDLEAPEKHVHEMKLQKMGIKLGSDACDADELLVPFSFYCSSPASDLRQLVDSNKVVTKRLVSWLTLFSKFSNLRSCWGHEELEDIFTRMLVKSKEQIQTLCMSCLINMKNKHLNPYREPLLALTKEEEYRNEMTKFTLGEESVVSPQHRGIVIPLVVRVLFGKLLVRKGKSTSKAKFSIANRRAAILAFFAGMEPHELVIFFRVMLRPFRNYSLPVADDKPPKISSSEAMELMANLNPEGISLTRLMGFARLAEDAIKQLGIAVEPYLHHLLCASLSMLRWLTTTVAERLTVSTDSEELDDAEEDNISDTSDTEAKRLNVVGHDANKFQRKEISVLRNTLLLRLTDMITKFPTYNYKPWKTTMFQVFRPLATQLPASMINARAPSALLRCVLAMSQHRQLWFLLADESVGLVSNTIRCLGTGLGRSSESSGLSSGGPGPVVVSTILQVIENLLDLGSETKISAMDVEDSSSSVTLLTPHMDLLLDQFQLRFSENASGGVTGGFTRQVSAGGKSAFGDAKHAQQSTISKRELDILSAVAAVFRQPTIDSAETYANSETCGKIVKLLLPFLRFLDAKGKKNGGGGNNSETDSRDSVLATIAQLLPLISNPLNHFSYLSKLLGPYGTQSITAHNARAQLVSVFSVMATLKDTAWMKPLSELLEDMNAYDSSRVNEYDFDRRLSAYERINSPEFRSKVLWPQTPHAVNLWVPVVYQIIQDMHDNEYALRTSAINTLVDIVKAAAYSTAVPQDESATQISLNSNWKLNEVNVDVVLNYILPGVKDGVRAQSTLIRNGFVTVMAEILRQVHTRKAEIAPELRKALHGDLDVLLDITDPEQDFFANLQHVQIHRRVAALIRLRKRLVADREQNVHSIQVASLVNIILPLVLHFLYEIEKSAERNLQEEALVTIGSISGHLSWSHYLKLLKQVLMQIPKKPALSKQLIKTSCLILDNFHFDQNCEKKVGESMDDENSENESSKEDSAPQPVTRIQMSLVNVVLPLLSGHLTAKVGAKEKTTIRTSVAIALVKVLKLLPRRMMNAKLPGLVHRICGVLKSREQDARSEARHTLAEVGKELGPFYLRMIAFELRSSLVEGYQMHVLGSALHTLLHAMEPSCVAAVAKRNEELKLSSETMQNDPVTSEQTDDMADEASNDGVETEKNTDEQDVETKEESDEHDMEAKKATNKQDVEAKDNGMDDASEIVENDKVVDSSSVVESLSIKVPPAPMDNAAGVIVDIIAKELFGDVGAQKNHDSDYKSKVKNLKEAKTSYGYESLETLARTISFLPVNTIHVILEPFLTCIDNTDDVKELRIAEEAIRRIGVGLTRNCDVRMPHMLVYVHHLLMEHRNVKFLNPSSTITSNSTGSNSIGGNIGVWLVNESLIAQKQAAEQIKARKAYKGNLLVEPTPQLTGRDRHENKKRRKRNARANSHLVVQHALEMLLGSLKQRNLKPTNATHIEMLDPFVTLLSNLVDKSKATRACVLSIRILTLFISWPLATLRQVIPRTCDRVFKLFRVVGNSQASGGGSSSAVVGSSASTLVDVKQACYRLLTGVLRRCDYYELSEQHLKYLVVMLQVDVENIQRQHATFSLLKAIVARRVASPELYDLMVQLTQLLFRAHRKELRQACTSILVEFLIHYPLGAKRLQEHLDLIVKNLEYPYEDGRLSGLEIINTVIRKFPEEKLDDLSQYLFLPMVTRLVNDDSTTCKEKIGANIKLLVAKIGTKELQGIIGILEKWLSTTNNQALQRVSAQAIGLVIEARGGQMRKSNKTVTSRLVETIVGVLATSEVAADNGESSSASGDESDENVNEPVEWTTLYYCLVALSKVFAVPSGLDEHFIGSPEVFPIIVKLLQYNHAWVRLAACRLVGLAFSRVEPEKADKPVVAMTTASIFMEPGIVFESALQLCRQLESELLNTSLADQCTKNLAWAFRFVYAFPELSMSGDKTTEGEHEGEQAVPDRLRGVNWLVHRLSYLARQRSRSHKASSARKTAVFKCIGAFALRLNSDDLERFLVKLIFPLFRQVERKTGGSEGGSHGRRAVTKTPEQLEYIQQQEALDVLAQEVLKVLENRCPSSQVYLRAYDTVRGLVVRQKEERVRKIAQEKITDPKRAAQRTKRKHKTKHDNAKRKRQRLREMSAR